MESGYRKNVGMQIVAAAILLAGAVAGVRIPVTMVSSVSSATAHVGDSFTFRTTESERAEDTLVPAGTLGYGVVTAVSHAVGTHRGTLTLNPEYLQLSSGARVRVAAANPAETSYAARRHLFPVAFPLGPFIVFGGVQNPGRDVTIGPGTSFDVVTTH